VLQLLLGAPTPSRCSNSFSVLQLLIDTLTVRVLSGHAEACADVCGRQSLFTQSTQRQRIVALGQADSVLVAQQLGVDVRDWRQTEGALQQDRARGGFEQAGAAHHLCDAHGGRCRAGARLS